MVPKLGLAGAYLGGFPGVLETPSEINSK